MSKKKKTRNIILLVTAMLICVAGYFVVTNIDFEKEEEVTTIPLYEDITAEDVVAFSYDVDGEVYSYSLINGVWYCDTELSKDLNQDTIASMLAILTGYSSEKTYEVDKESFADYGLEEPFKVINFETSDGTVHKLTVGDNNINKKYYAYKDDESTVYTIDATVNVYFDYTLEDICVEESTAAAE